jgi:hypothetical protein
VSGDCTTTTRVIEATRARVALAAGCVEEGPAASGRFEFGARDIAPPS